MSPAQPPNDTTTSPPFARTAEITCPALRPTRSTMNGDTGAGETITQADFRKIRTYVHQRGLGRFTFWAVNRDWPCPSRGSRPCSGVPQRPWQFTDIVNQVPAGP